MSKFDFSQAVLFSNGDLDMESTTEAFQKALCAWYENTRAELALVRLAVIKAFDGYAPGTRIPKPLVVQIAMMHLGATPDTWRSLEDQINLVLQDRTTFDVARGRAGGVMLIRTAS
jgi:uncharacterized protein (DUF849 family)